MFAYRLLASEQLTSVAKAAADGCDWSVANGDLRRAIEPVTLHLQFDGSLIRGIDKCDGRL